MAVSEQKLAQIIAHSKEVNEHPILNERQNMKFKQNSYFNNINGDNEYDNEYRDEWDNIGSLSNYDTYQSMPSLSYTEEQVLNSKLPEDIKKSLIKNPIRQETNEQTMDSVASMVASKNSKTVNRINEVKKEPQNSQIDYNYIKYLMSEAISDYFEKNPITNSAFLKQIAVSSPIDTNGGKIKIVDNNGNIFSAQLEYTGNLKDRKK